MQIDVIVCTCFTGRRWQVLLSVPLLAALSAEVSQKEPEKLLFLLPYRYLLHCNGRIAYL